jgi:hypothetical protein
MQTLLIPGLIVATLAVGCAAAPTLDETLRSRVDPISIGDRERFEADVAECKGLAWDVRAVEARRDKAEAQQRTVVGAAGGALVGAAAGSALDEPGTGALVGAASGSSARRLSAPRSSGPISHQAAANCMVNRGYMLLY